MITLSAGYYERLARDLAGENATLRTQLRTVANERQDLIGQYEREITRLLDQFGRRGFWRRVWAAIRGIR